MDTSRQRINSPLTSSYGSTEQDDRGTFDELSRQISGLIFKINNNANVLERQAKRIATKDDGPQLREKLHSVQRETNELAGAITPLIKALNDLCQLGERQKKLQVERLKTSFRAALERYHQIQKKVTEQVKSESLRQSQQAQSFDQEHDTWSDEAALLEQNQRREQLMQQQVEIDDELALARDREERIRDVESDVLDVNEIFRELGNMVYEQGDMVDDITSNVVTASDYVEEGNVQLDKAVSYQKSYRKKLCILVVILLVVAGVIALILGLSLKK